VSPLAKYLIETLITLFAVIALAVLVLYGARRLGVGRPLGPLSLVGRLPLDGRRAIYLVRVGATVYVVGASEAGLSKLGEVDGDKLDLSETAAAPSAFAEVLARAVHRARNPESAATTPRASEKREEEIS
jgi:flagellar protein FliO/FliZ